jgi:hypothetical protein
VTDNDKHSNLLRYRIDYGSKIFNSTGPLTLRTNQLEQESLTNTGLHAKLNSKKAHTYSINNFPKKSASKVMHVIAFVPGQIIYPIKPCKAMSNICRIPFGANLTIEN